MLLGTVTPKSIILNSIYYKKESCYKWISVLKQITSNLLASFILMRQSLIEVLSLLKLYSISLMPATIKLFFFFPLKERIWNFRYSFGAFSDPLPFSAKKRLVIFPQKCFLQLPLESSVTPPLSNH